MKEARKQERSVHWSRQRDRGITIATETRDTFPTLPSLLSVRQLSELLQIPVSTIYGWRYKREGPKASKVGRYLRFSTDDVLRWLENKAH